MSKNAPRPCKRTRQSSTETKTEKKQKPDADWQEVIHWSVGLPNAKSSQELQSEKVKIHTKHLQQYDDLHTAFLEEGISQLSHLLVRRIAHDAKIPPDYRSQPLLRLLTDTVQDMMMNELEIVVWAIYLERFIWKEGSGNLHQRLLQSAYAVKTYLNDDVSPYQAHLIEKFSNFTQSYNMWLASCKNYMGINPRDLNNKFKQLSKSINSSGDPRVVDYNYYVDEILQISPPYHLESKNPLYELKNDPQIKRVYEAFKNNEKIIVKKDATHTLEELADPSTMPGGEVDNPTTVLGKLDSILGPLKDWDEPAPMGLSRNCSMMSTSSIGGIIASSMLMDRIDSLCTECMVTGDPKKDSVHPMTLRRAKSREDSLPFLGPQVSLFSSLINNNNE